LSWTCPSHRMRDATQIFLLEGRGLLCCAACRRGFCFWWSVDPPLAHIFHSNQHAAKHIIRIFDISPDHFAEKIAFKRLLCAFYLQPILFCPNAPAESVMHKYKSLYKHIAYIVTLAHVNGVPFGDWTGKLCQLVGFLLFGSQVN